MNIFKKSLLSTLFFVVFSLPALAHGGGKSCKSSLFDYKQTFNISSDDVSVIKSEFVTLLDNGDAYYCPTGDQSTSISKKPKCVLQSTH